MIHQFPDSASARVPLILNDGVKRLPLPLGDFFGSILQGLVVGWQPSCPESCSHDFPGGGYHNVGVDGGSSRSLAWAPGLVAFSADICFHDIEQWDFASFIITCMLESICKVL